MDIEMDKSPNVTTTIFPAYDHSTSGSDVNADPYNTASARVRQNSVANGRGILTRLRHYEALLDKKIGVEGSGPERILPEEREPPKTWMMALVWASGTMNLSCFATGFLGWEFGLSLKQSILTMIFGTLVGAATTGWCATLGPKTGLRQVSISRYSFGWWPVKIIAALNVVEQLGWSSVGCITGGQALSAVTNGSLSIDLGIIIVSVTAVVFSFIGLRAVLKYEEYAWAVFFVIFMIIFGQAGKYSDNTTPSTLTGATLSGTVLSLFAVVYGSSASWCSIVSDYYVQYPVHTNSWKVFSLTTLGIALPTCIGLVAGACVASNLDNNETWLAAWDDGIGETVQVILYPNGFAKFILVLLVLSGIGMNCIAIYSGALSIQQFAKPLQAIPRFIWTLLMFVGIVLLSLAGATHLLTFLDNFLSLLGYWNTAYFVIVAVEHYLFRGGDMANYDLEGWNDRRRLPVGYAGGMAFALGIVGCVLGMDETWYVGVVAKTIGAGGDVGNELALILTLVSFVPLRYFERKYTGR